jgi:hypothetical protein
MKALGKLISSVAVAGLLSTLATGAVASPVHRSQVRRSAQHHVALITADKPTQINTWPNGPTSDDTWYTPPKSPGFRPFIGG